MLIPQLPIPRGKKAPPFFQEWESKSPEELEELLSKFPNSNRGLRLDHYIQVDPDNEVAIRKVKQFQAEGILSPTLTYETWGGIECPLYLAHPEIMESFDITADGMKLQIRTDAGHYCLIPDSTVKGKPYRWAKHLGPADIDAASLTDEAVRHLRAIASNNNNKKYSSNSSYSRGDDFKLDFKQGARDMSLFRVANWLTRAGAPEADIRQVLNILGQNCSPPFPGKDIIAKILSAERRQNQREKSISEEVREWVLTSDGFFLTSDCFRELGLTSRDFQKAGILALLKMHKAGIIERHGQRRGCYRRIDTTAEELRWWEADTSKSVDLILPFDIHHLVTIYPKNIIIVAGATNAGKTALLLNIARLNMDRFKINFFSNEMPEQELKKRLECFFHVGLICDVNEWRKVNFKERIHDFHQVVKPDEVNIIDYIEVTSDPWKVADQINDIYRKLEKGIAIIALQKKKGTEFAIGGHYSAFRSRLYLAMENHELKIVKAKNWAGNINPNNKVYRYKLIQGAKFIES